MTGHVNPFAPTDADRDAWTRRVVETHFDPDGGTPYWLRWAADADVDPRSAVDGFDDLKSVFEPFDGDVLRTLPAGEFAPRSLTGPRRVYETGGTTGPPKRVVMSDYWRDQSRWTARVLAEWGFPEGNVLGLCPPGGANNAGRFVDHLADGWGTLPYHVAMDPRWAKALSERGDRRAYDRYVDHLLDQAARVLASQDVRVLFTTGRLLERPALRDLVADHGIEGIVHGGTAVDPDANRAFREDWYADATLVGEYGNTLMGIAPEAPLDLRPLADRPPGYGLEYVPCEPYVVPEIVGADGEPVDYGDRGRVRLTVLSEELFLPLFPERDGATRVRGAGPFPWDWVGTPDTRPGEDRAVEGVY